MDLVPIDIARVDDELTHPPRTRVIAAIPMRRILVLPLNRRSLISLILYHGLDNASENAPDPRPTYFVVIAVIR
jgi:hypothetical protein